MNSSYFLSVLLLLLSFKEIAPVYRIPAATKEFCDNSITGQLIFPQNTPRLIPRVFPVCFGRKPNQNAWATDIQNYAYMYRVLRTVENEHNAKNNIPVRFDPQSHAMSLAPNGGDLRVYPLLDNRGNVIERKLYLAFDFTRGLQNRVIEGIYLQGIQGPYGYPFGFFHIDSTLHRNGDSSRYEQLSDENHDYIHACTYKADDVSTGLAPRLPHAIMWDRSHAGASRNIQQRFGVIFHYDETQACTQAPFFQFIVVIVYRDGTEKFAPLLTNIVVPPPGWYHQDLHNAHIPYPTGARVGNELVGAVRDFHRITPNFDYERCMRYGRHYTQNGEIYSCLRGSGQLQCNQGNPLQANQRQPEYQNWITAYDRYNADRPICEDAPPPPPTTTTTTTTTTPTTSTSTTTTTTPSIAAPTTTTTPGTPTVKPLIQDLTQRLGEIAKQVERKKKITHGDLCIYVWYVLFPPANYIARFFKDSQKKVAFSLGYWIVIHVAAHHIGILLIWISFGLVLASGDNFFSGVSAIHFVFGLGATVFQMILIFHSMWPRIEKQFTLKDAPVQHVSYGYATWAMTTICIYYSNNITRAKMSMVAALIGVTLVSNLVGVFIEKRIDKYLMVFPPRRYFPELETLAIEGKTPYTVVKRFWFWVYSAVLYGLYFWLAFHQKLFTAA